MTVLTLPLFLLTFTDLKCTGQAFCRKSLFGDLWLHFFLSCLLDANYGLAIVGGFGDVPVNREECKQHSQIDNIDLVSSACGGGGAVAEGGQLSGVCLLA